MEPSHTPAGSADMMNATLKLHGLPESPDLHIRGGRGSGHPAQRVAQVGTTAYKSATDSQCETAYGTKIATGTSRSAAGEQGHDHTEHTILTSSSSAQLLSKSRPSALVELLN
ncbi:hypothetical protein MY10362_009823 [Beauveria mimosiformis]